MRSGLDRTTRGNVGLQEVTTVTTVTGGYRELQRVQGVTRSYRGLQDVT